MATAPSQKRVHRRFDSPQQEAFLALWRTYDRLRAFEDDLFARFDLTPQQYNALRLLRAEHPDPLPTLVLAERLVSRAPDITRLLDGLELKGLIARERHAENRRVVQVGISDGSPPKSSQACMKVIVSPSMIRPPRVAGRIHNVA